MVPIKQVLVSDGMHGVKCPFPMTPTRFVVHNTANDASAANEIQYMSTNSNEVSFHYAIDEKEIIQGIPENRNAWHAGDGGVGIGNRQGLGIEICYSISGGNKFIQAERNAAEFIASKLKEFGWGIDRVTKHQDYSNKYCPHRTLDMGWQRFLDMISSYMGNKPVEPTAPSSGSTEYGVGTPVTYTGLWTQANGGAWYSKAQLSIKEGSITKIVTGAEHPYLINGGIGWAMTNVLMMNLLCHVVELQWHLLQLQVVKNMQLVLQYVLIVFGPHPTEVKSTLVTGLERSRM